MSPNVTIKNRKKQNEMKTFSRWVRFSQYIASKRISSTHIIPKTELCASYQNCSENFKLHIPVISDIECETIFISDMC